jgi:superfamily II DNA or RNA helicase
MINNSVLNNIKESYISGEDNLGKDFFEPCMTHCKQYDRWGAFFTSKSIASWSNILPKIATKEKEVKIRLLITPLLSEEDKKILEEVTDENTKINKIEKINDEIIEDSLNFMKNNESKSLRLEIFSWLVSNEIIEIKFAYPKHVNNPSIFHAKSGIFHFNDDFKIAFLGSGNETQGGHNDNFEELEVFKNWNEEEQSRVNKRVNRFELSWNKNMDGLEVYDLSKDILKYIKTYSPSDDPRIASNTSNNYKWRHQDEALEAFLLAKKGILEMATGTGKTNTSLKIANHLIQAKKIDSLIISTHGNPLLYQWNDEIFEKLLKEYNLKFNVYKNFDKFKEIDRYLNNPKKSILIVSQASLNKVISKLKQKSNIILILDEVHIFGSKKTIKDLNNKFIEFEYLLGLSATPDRGFDQEGNEFIQNNIGETFFKFDLKKAINRGILCEFDYHLIPYELTDDERADKNKAFRAYQGAKRNGELTPEQHQEFRTAIASYDKKAENKIPAFINYLKVNPNSIKSSFIFIWPIEFGEKIIPEIQAFTPHYRSLLGDVKKPIQKTKLEFKNKEIECIITCKRLSQGVDVQNLRSVIMFYCEQDLLTIQRIGRTLRSDPNDPDKKGLIIDFYQPSQINKLDFSDTKRLKWLKELSLIKNNE